MITALGKEITGSLKLKTSQHNATQAAVVETSNVVIRIFMGGLKSAGLN